MQKIPEEQKKFNSLMLYGLSIHWVVLGTIAILITAKNPSPATLAVVLVWMTASIWLYTPNITTETAYEYMKGKTKVQAVIGGFLSPFWFLVILIVHLWEKAKTWATSKIE